MSAKRRTSDVRLALLPLLTMHAFGSRLKLDGFAVRCTQVRLPPRFNASVKLVSTDYFDLMQKLLYRSENGEVVGICIIRRACSLG